MRSIVVGAALLATACAGPSSLDPASMDEATFDRELARRFQYGPPEPHPQELADRRAGQIADAAYFAAFPDYDRSYSHATRAEARRMIERLRAEAGYLNHEQFVLRIAEIVAIADNGHTAIGRNAFLKDTPRVPLRTYLFADGLYVLHADQVNAPLLGARIDRIDGRSVAEIYRVIRRYRGGAEAFRRMMLIPLLESPAMLEAAGLARERGALTYAGVLADGTPFETRVVAEERDRSAWVSSTSRLLYPDTLDELGFYSYIHNGPDLPVYLHSARNLFWTEALPQNGFYIGIAHNADADEGPIAPFLDNALTRVRSERPSFIVLDMRMNGGGDLTTTYDFARALPQAAAEAPIYVLTSSWTFSAAITTVAALEEVGGRQVIIVGEPVGDRLDFWAAEGGRGFELPNAFITANFSTGRHVYDGSCTDRETCIWFNLSHPVQVRSLDPDIEAPLTFAAYRALRDPAMDAVLARQARGRSSARTH
jgi:CheY-like chemotaxis protein